MIVSALVALVTLAAPRVSAVHDVEGRFADTHCAEPAVESVLEADARALAQDAVHIDTGDLLGASPLGAFAVHHDLTALVSAIDRLNLSARAIGHRDLAGPRDQLIAFAHGVHLPSVLTNLRCSAAATELCDALATGDEAPVVVDTPNGKVGFIAAVSPDALNNVATALKEGLTLLPPAEEISDATRRARALGATVVIAVYDPAIGHELDDALFVARQLDPKASPDVLLVNGVHDALTTATVGKQHLPVIATPGAGVLNLAPDADGRLQPIEIEPTPRNDSDGLLAGYSKDLAKALCGSFRTPLAGGTLPHPYSREEAAAWALDVMREQTRAEVAVINGPAISPHAPWPVSSLTPLVLMQMLPFDNQLRVATLQGDKLALMLDAPIAKTGFVRGAAKHGDVWKVNGRDLEPAQKYRVVTIDYVADSLGKTLGVNEPTKDRATVREQLTAWLERKPPAAVIDPAQRTRWWFSYRIQIDLNSTSVSNPNQAVFTDTQLARGQSFSFAGETEARAIGDHPLYSWENQLLLRYGLLQTTDLNGATTGLANNVDLLTGRTTAVARQLFGSTAWYLPRPYADISIESELTRPAERSYHHLMLLPTAGIRFQLTQQFSVYVGGGATWEVLAHEQDLTPQVPPAAAVLVAGWALRPWKIAKLGERWVEAETNLDYWVRDLSGPTQSQARARARLVLPLFSLVSLTATYDLFFRSVRLQDEMTGRWSTLFGVSHDAYLGLQAAIGGAVQSFAF